MAVAYVPHTEEDRQKMLAACGLASVDDLFAGIPAAVRLSRDPDLPPRLSEMELVRHLETLAAKNAAVTCFLGGGCYDHFVPAVVDAVTGRSEFYTAYTPYQPEISQGTLTAIYEFQTMIAELTGLDVANASMYDGASALAEAAVMAVRKTGRPRVAVARCVHPEYRQVLATYLTPRGVELEELPFRNGVTVVDALTPRTAALIVQQPNFFGCLEDVETMARAAHAAGALLVVCADPVSLGLLKPPGEYGADIACGEGQSLGLPMSFGGPGLGFLAARAELVRHLPGRIVGATVDTRGQRAFVLTLQAREQHIRREKATSNICSNQALCALAATVHLSALGPAGLARVADLCAAKAAYARQRVAAVPGFAAAFAAPFFKEFVVKSHYPWEKIEAALLAHDLVAGPELGRFYPELAGHFLVAVTETRTRDDIDRLQAALAEVAAC